MDPTEVLKQIDLDAHILVEKIKQYSRLQKDTWQKVPYLALQTQGIKPGWNCKYSKAYREGYWEVIPKYQISNYTICVNLETGELVNASNPSQPATDRDILAMSFDIDRLNASDIIEELINASRESMSWKGYSLKELTEWRSSKQIQLQLQPDSYKRIVASEKL